MRHLLFITAVLASGTACSPPSTTPPLECREIETVTGESSGYQLCGPGAVERQEAAACTSSDADYSFACVTASDTCATDDDCTQPGKGTCVEYYDGCYCGRTSCMADDDCGDGFACVCHEARDDGLEAMGNGDRLTGRNACVPAECRSNADCSEGQACRLSRGGESCCDAADYRGFFCTTPDDECRTDDDCSTGGCVFDPGRARWTCAEWRCACD